MTGRASYRLPDATTLRLFVVGASAIAVAAAVAAIWFFVDGRRIFGGAWVVLALGWACVAFFASRTWAGR